MGGINNAEQEDKGDHHYPNFSHFHLCKHYSYGQRSCHQLRLGDYLSPGPVERPDLSLIQHIKTFKKKLSTRVDQRLKFTIKY